MTDSEFLEQVFQKPAMYLGRKTLTGLSFFISGYEACLRNTKNRSLTFDFRKFQEFVSSWYGVPNCYSWDKVILMAESSEENSFDRFLDLRTKFLAGVDPVHRV